MTGAMSGVMSGAMFRHDFTHETKEFQIINRWYKFNRRLQQVSKAVSPRPKSPI